ncbi:MAG: response regulator transcription factor [Myxococcales bacterium]|nr:response regulator transcription factor [Myxococcales bacterium]
MLVVDDEAPARRRLCRLLAVLGEVVGVGAAADGVEARAQIDALAPDAVLLDVQMPELDGLALARGGAMPKVIFTTAHAQHAIEAFELAAVDYLRKPIERDRLRRAIDRVREHLGRAAPPEVPSVDDVLRAARGRADAPQAAPARLAAREGGRVRMFDVGEITRLFAQDKYVVLRHDGREVLLDDSLAELEVRLAPHGFVRVHRSELINLAAVVSIVGEGSAARVELRDGQWAAVARRELPALRRRLGFG